jgi:uncharacterized OB-fold protein
VEPISQSPLARYVEHLEAGELAFQVCLDDDSPVFFPRVIAPKTGSANLEWRVSKGVGTVYSTTVVHYRGEPPLNVVLVDMDEGFRLMSRVADIAPEEVLIGMRVKARVHAPGDAKLPYPVFVPVAEEGAVEKRS